MAKGKHAAALFEVIHSQRRLEPLFKRPGVLRAPRWFAGKSITPIFALVTRSRTAAEIAEPAPAQLVTPPDEPVNDLPPVPAVREIAAPIPLESAATGFAVDRDRQQISFRLSFTSAAITGFAIVVALTMAYVLGRSISHPAAPAVAGLPTSAALRAGPSRPDVLNVGGASDSRASEPRHATLLAGTENPRASKPAPLPSETGDAIGAGTPSSGRVVGLNYLIIQSYADEKDANEARDLLVKSGINCTVEYGTGFAPTRYCVVGMQGFGARMSGTTDYENYLQQINDVSARFAGKNSTRRFDPKPYKWKNTR